MSPGEMAGTFGVSLLLLAFALNIMGRLRADSATYLSLNAIGAAFACLSSVLIMFWPFVVLEGVWTVSSLVALVKTMRK